MDDVCQEEFVGEETWFGAKTRRILIPSSIHSGTLRQSYVKQLAQERFPMITVRLWMEQSITHLPLDPSHSLPLFWSVSFFNFRTTRHRHHP